MNDYNRRVNQTTIKALTAKASGINPQPLVTEDLDEAGDKAAEYLLDLYAKTLAIAHGTINYLAHLQEVDPLELIQQLALQGENNDQ